MCCSSQKAIQQPNTCTEESGSGDSEADRIKEERRKRYAQPLHLDLERLCCDCCHLCELQMSAMLRSSSIEVWFCHSHSSVSTSKLSKEIFKKLGLHRKSWRECESESTRSCWLPRGSWGPSSKLACEISKGDILICGLKHTQTLLLVRKDPKKWRCSFPAFHWCLAVNHWIIYNHVSLYMLLNSFVCCPTLQLFAPWHVTRTGLCYWESRKQLAFFGSVARRNWEESNCFWFWGGDIARMFYLRRKSVCVCACVHVSRRTTLAILFVRIHVSSAPYCHSIERHGYCSTKDCHRRQSSDAWR